MGQVWVVGSAAEGELQHAHAGQTEVIAQTLDRVKSLAAPASAGKGYSMTATGPGGHRIGSSDGKTWYDLQTGQQVK